MGSELGDAVGVDVVDAGNAEFGPEPIALGRTPEPDAAALGMGASDELMEFETIGFREAWMGWPLEMRRPGIADEGDEMDGGSGIEIGGASIDGAEPFGLGGDDVGGAGAGEDDGDGARDGVGGGEPGEYFPVLPQQWIEDGVGALGVGLDVDEQGEAGKVGMDMAGVGAAAIAEGIEVEGGEGAFGAHLMPVMGNEELAVDEMDVGFDGVESVIQSEGEGPFLFVIVVGMGVGKRGRRVAERPEMQEGEQGDEQEAARWAGGSDGIGHGTQGETGETGTPISTRASRMA